MKKILSLAITFLLILMMMPINASEQVSALNEDGTIVVYGALVKSEDTQYSGLYSVRQSLYKSEFSTENDVSASAVSGDLVKNASAELCTSSTSYDSWPKIANSLCSGGELKAILAQFYMDQYSNLTVRLQNDVTVHQLNIYYTIAGVTENDHSSTVFVMCTNPSGGYKICNHAKKISSTVDANHGNWQSAAKRGGEMAFTEVTMESAGFNKRTNDAGVIYDSYNIMENMPDKVKSLAYASGAYIIITMSVEAPDPTDSTEQRRDTFYINTMLYKEAEFGYVSSISGPSDSTIVSYTNVNADATSSVADADYQLRNASLGFVDRVAGLVAVTPEKLVDNEMLDKFIDIFEEYIKPILEIGLGVLLLVRGTILIVGIVKASDEPEVRKDNIKHLVSLFVSILIIMVIVWFFADIIDALSELMVGFM